MGRSRENNILGYLKIISYVNQIRMYFGGEEKGEFDSLFHCDAIAIY